MINRIISLSLCLLIILSAFCSCKNGGTQTGVTSKDEGTSSNANLDSSDSSSSKDDELASSNEDASSTDDTVSEEEYIEELEEEPIVVPVTTEKTLTALPAEHTSLLSQNPDRGWFSEDQYWITTDMETLKNATLETVKAEVSRRVSVNTLMEGVTLSRVYFIMNYYKDTYDLPEETVRYLDLLLQAYREIGVKVYLNIYYQQGLGVQDYGANKETILNHLDDYGMLWEKHKDNIFAYHLSLLGSYGEWTSIKPKMYDSDKQEIVDKVLKLLPEQIYLVVNDPENIKAKFFSKDDPRFVKIGHTKDSMFGKMFPDQDMGQANVRPGQPAWQMVMEEAPYAITTGELFTTRWLRDEGKIYVEPFSTIQALSEMRFTAFNVNHGYGDIAMFGGRVEETNLYGWKCTEITAEKLKELGVLHTSEWFKNASGKTVQRNTFEYVRDYLGYHLSADKLSITGGTKKNESINISMDFRNYGFSAAFNLKSGFAILNEKNEVVSEVSVGDPTTWHPTSPDDYSDRTQLKHNLSAKMSLPSTAGVYKVAFFLRNTLGQTARLDNTIEYSNGYNILHMFTIE